MLELDARRAGTLAREAHLDLARGFGSEVGVELEAPVEVPREDDPVRRLVGGHAAPDALAAVGSDLVPAAALAALEDDLLERHARDLVVSRPPAVEALGEHVERALDRGLHEHALPDCLDRCHRRHRSSSSLRSAAALKAARASFQNWSRYSRMALTPSGSIAYRRRVPSWRS